MVILPYYIIAAKTKIIIEVPKEAFFIGKNGKINKLPRRNTEA